MVSSPASTYPLPFPSNHRGVGGGTSPAITEFISVDKTMRGYSPPHRSPPRRGYGGRGRSPPRRGYGGRRDQSSGSLLVRNIPLSCRPDDLRVPFERQPRGFAFVEFVDPYDASEAQYHMNRQVYFGREITVVVAAESRKSSDDMRRRARVRGYSGEHGRRHSRYGRSRSRSRSYSPRYRGRPRSRSYSPAPRRRDDSSASPSRSHHTQSPRRRHEDDKRRSYSPAGRSGGQHDGKRSPPPESDGSPPRRRSPRPSSESPVRSRSRTPDASPARSD